MTGSTDAADSPERSPVNVEASKAPKRKQRVLRKVVIWVAIVVVLLVVLWSVSLRFVAGWYLVPSESMAPTLHGCAGCTGDRVLVDKLTYRFGSPQPGDVIVFKGPPSWNTTYRSIRSSNTAVRWMQNTLSFIGLVPPDENDLVKRVIAVGGQTVQCRVDTGLTVDGKPLKERYLDPATMGTETAAFPCLNNTPNSEFGPVTVPPGRLWVMGDNRTHSADSRAHCNYADLATGPLCSGDPMAGTIPVDNVIGKVTGKVRL